MSLTDEQLEIRGLARDFAEQEIRGEAVVWDEGGAVDASVIGKLAELGFLGIVVDPEHGGLGLDPTTYALIVEELARGDASLALLVGLHNAPVASLVAASPSEAVRTSWLPRLASGERRGALASWAWDLPSAASGGLPVARDAEAGWSVSGRLRAFGAADADLLVVPMRPPSGKGDAWALLEASASGLSVEPEPTPMGLRAAGAAVVLLDDVAVDAEQIVGESRSPAVRAAFDLGRVAVAAAAVGLCACAIDHAASYALEREQFGRSIARFGAIRAKLGEMARRTEAARALTLVAAERLANGSRDGESPPDSSAAMARITAADAAVWVTDEAVQIHGGYGYMKDYPVEKPMRDAQGMQVLGGARESLHECVVGPLLAGADRSTTPTISR